MSPSTPRRSLIKRREANDKIQKIVRQGKSRGLYFDGDRALSNYQSSDKLSVDSFKESKIANDYSSSRSGRPILKLSRISEQYSQDDSADVTSKEKQKSSKSNTHAKSQKS